MPLTLCRILVFAFIFSFSVSQVDAEQFSHWFRIYRSTLLDYAGEKCKDNYTRMDWPQYGEDPHIEKIDNCKNMASCLLKNLNDFDKADMQSASVLLGLMPTALSYIGPTISELALLFSRRPVLVTLMVIGAPVISVTRLFDFTSLEAPLNHHEWPFHRHVKSKARAGWIIFIQYFFIAGAVAMSLENSVFLGRMTILSWKCLYSLMPFWWNLMSLVILLVAALARWVSKRFQTDESKWYNRELRPSIYQPRLRYNNQLDETRKAICLYWLAALFVFVHWIFGTLVFSSTLFIATLDALGVIARYTAAALLCRIILICELGGIKGAERETAAVELNDRAQEG